MMHLFRKQFGYLLIAMLSLFVMACMQPVAVREEPMERMVSPIQTYSYTRDIKPILERKCIACHGCYDAPCQLKLTCADRPTASCNPKVRHWTLSGMAWVMDYPMLERTYYELVVNFNVFGTAAHQAETRAIHAGGQDIRPVQDPSADLDTLSLVCRLPATDPCG